VEVEPGNWGSRFKWGRKVMLGTLAAFMVLITASGFGEPATPNDGPGRVYEGVYRYDHGDRLRVECDRKEGCSHTLVRDETLQRMIVRYGDRIGTIKFVGEEVDACTDPRSSEFACISAPNKRAVIIRDWIDYRGKK
jgi:hypothetical protein